MSITTLSELQTAVGDRIARSDFTTSQTNECIALAENEMQCCLRAVDMETKQLSFTVQSEFQDLPTNFLELRSLVVYANGVRYPLQYMSDEMQAFQNPTGSDIPQFYSISGGMFHFSPPPSGSYTATLVYFTSIPPLSSTNTTNWLLTKWPMAYLYGALKHAAVRLGDSAAAQGYDTLFQQALRGIQMVANRARVGPGMVTRPA